MPHTVHPELRDRLERTRARLAAWRAANAAPKPIPLEIWKAAVELSHQMGLGTVSRELKLDYGGLKRRAGEKQVTGADFIEFLSPVISERIGSCVLQLQSTRCQATVQLQDVTPQALGDILREVLL